MSYTVSIAECILEDSLIVSFVDRLLYSILIACLKHIAKLLDFVGCSNNGIVTLCIKHRTCCKRICHSLVKTAFSCRFFRKVLGCELKISLHKIPSFILGAVCLVLGICSHVLIIEYHILVTLDEIEIHVCTEETKLRLEAYLIFVAHLAVSLEAIECLVCLTYCCVHGAPESHIDIHVTCCDHGSAI